MRYYGEQQLHKMLNNGLTLFDNLDGAYFDLTITSNGTTVNHGLGRVPTGYIVLSVDGPGDVYSWRLAEWTSEIMYLKSSVTSLRVRFFVV